MRTQRKGVSDRADFTKYYFTLHVLCSFCDGEIFFREKKNAKNLNFSNDHAIFFMANTTAKRQSASYFIHRKCAQQLNCGCRAKPLYIYIYIYIYIYR